MCLNKLFKMFLVLKASNFEINMNIQRWVYEETLIQQAHGSGTGRGSLLHPAVIGVLKECGTEGL